jgi:multiple antibiotic resistance protein
LSTGDLLGLLWAFGGAVLALFPIVDPVTAGFSFAGITQGRSVAWKRRQALLACIYMVVILLCFQVLGTVILTFFAITLDAIRVAGGLMLWYAAIEMLQGTEKLTTEEKTDVIGKEDVAFTPMAMPLLSGPGAIAVTLSLSARAESITNEIAVGLAVVTMATITYVCLRFAPLLQKKFSETGRLAFTKMLGFLLLCVSVQFVMTGVAPLLGK